MPAGRLVSTVHRYKPTISVFCIISFAAIYALHLISTANGVWMRHFTPVYVTEKHVVENRSAEIFDVVLRNYNTSKNNKASTDFITALPEGPNAKKTGRYVSMCKRNFDRRRIGNQLFNLVAMLRVAWLTGRRVAMVRHHPNGWLDRWFEVPVTRVNRIDKELCPCVNIGEKSSLAYYAKMSRLSKRRDITGKSLLVCGYFHSWKYTVGIESAIRYHLRLLPNISAAVYSYLVQIRPPAWKEQSFMRIGIHVRAGDMMRPEIWQLGYTIPQPPYFEKAMSWFVNQQQQQMKKQPVHIQFIVASNSLAWVKAAINFTSIAHQLRRTLSDVALDVTYSEDHDAGFDLALLSKCDGLIISTGSYGWWSAWLANKTTIYYSNYPRVGSSRAEHFVRDDYFPPNWIPVSGPEFPCCQK